MRKLILAMQMSLDGMVGGPDGEMDWVTMSEEMDDQSLPRLMERCDTCLLGRSLYQGFASYWPTAPQTNPNLSRGEVAFSGWIERARKVVFSNTLEQADWNNSSLARDPAVEVARLKGESGKDMVTFGGARLAQALARQGLVDEYQLMLNPVILGQGLPLFKEVTELQRLKLVSVERFSDAVGLTYLVS